MLTARQTHALAYIQAYRAEFGASPTYAQIARSLRLSNRGAAVALVRRLARRGYVVLMGGRRGILPFSEMPAEVINDFAFDEIGAAHAPALAGGHEPAEVSRDAAGDMHKRHDGHKAANQGG